jgi:hypothetical protein
MHKNATKCNETIGKWCKNKHGASKIIDTFETYQRAAPIATGVAHRWSALFGDGVSSLRRTNSNPFLTGDNGASLTGETAQSGRLALKTGSTVSTATSARLHPGVGLIGDESTAMELLDELEHRSMVLVELPNPSGTYASLPNSAPPEPANRTPRPDPPRHESPPPLLPPARRRFSPAPAAATRLIPESRVASFYKILVVT